LKSFRVVYVHFHHWVFIFALIFLLSIIIFTFLGWLFSKATIKLQHNDDIRRVVLAEGQANYKRILKVSRLKFGSSLPESFLLKYRDTEGDLVTIGCNDDFNEALLQQPRGQTLKINIVSASLFPEKISSSLAEIARGLGVALEEAYRGLTEQPTKECKYNNTEKKDESKDKHPVMEVDVDYSEALQMFNHNAVQLIRSGKLEEAERVLLYTLKYFPNNPTLFYNLACTFSLRGDAERAVDALKKSFSVGFNDIQAFENDPDLDPIRNLPSFQELIAENCLVFQRDEPKLEPEPEQVIEELPQVQFVEEPPKISEPEAMFAPLLKLRPVEVVAPIVVEAPKSAENEAVEKALSQLVEMGFTDWELNVRMLAKNNLDMLSTVRDLLEN